MSKALTAQEIAESLRNVGVEEGGICIFHSSFKSLGPVEGGAQTVIDGFERAIGREGTLVVPTLCSVDFRNSYKTWYRDKPSDVGYLTEYFRKLPFVYRSDHPTHSVAARGALAYELTFEHTWRGHHYCSFGDGTFADSSPWRKMYDRNAKQVFLGVNLRKNTMKHMIEGWLIEELLAAVPDQVRRQELKARLHVFAKDDGGILMQYDGSKMEEELKARGLVREGECGQAHVMCLSAREASDAALDVLRTHPERVYKEGGADLQWIADCREAAKA